MNPYQPPQSTIDQPTSTAPSFWRRGAAWGYDYYLFFGLPMLVSSMGTVGFALFLWLVAIVGYMVYNVMMEVKVGTTVGKYLVGIAVENNQGQMLSVPEALTRFAGCMLSWVTLNIGHALAVWRKDRKTLHDLITNTRVVHKDMVFDHAPYLTSGHHTLLMTASLVGQAVIFVAIMVFSMIAFVDAIEKASVYAGA